MAAALPLLEAALGDETVVTRADLLRPVEGGWELVEVKASGSVKPHHVEDVAIQAAAAARGGVPIVRSLVAHLDTGWTYPGGEAYQGLFREVDVTDEVDALVGEIDEWIASALATLAAAAPPLLRTGKHCDTPNPCPFHDLCTGTETPVARPVDWLPGRLRREAQALRAAGVVEMDDLPDDLLTDLQRRVKHQTLAGGAWFDAEGAAADLASCSFPLHFLDFETVNPDIPIWPGTRPYGQIPFQFSLHVLDAAGELEHRECLIADGEDPTRRFAEALLRTIGPAGHVVVYNAAFERSRIRELATRFPALTDPLLDIAGRLFDLQPVVRARYYHPDQQGSWSIKKLLPCLVPELRYSDLEGIRDGGMAAEACLELLDPGCCPARRDVLERQLRRYCHLDTLAMVAIWARLVGSGSLLAKALLEDGAGSGRGPTAGQGKTAP